MARPVEMVLSIPKAATATPYMAAKLKLTKIAMAMENMGSITELYPNAKPKITFVAAPVRQESATSRTGLPCLKKNKINKITIIHGENENIANRDQMKLQTTNFQLDIEELHTCMRC